MPAASCPACGEHLPQYQGASCRKAIEAAASPS